MKQGGWIVYYILIINYGVCTFFKISHLIKKLKVLPSKHAWPLKECLLLSGAPSAIYCWFMVVQVWREPLSSRPILIFHWPFFIIMFLFWALFWVVSKVSFWCDCPPSPPPPPAIYCISLTSPLDFHSLRVRIDAKRVAVESHSPRNSSFWASAAGRTLTHVRLSFEMAHLRMHNFPHHFSLMSDD